MGVSIYAVGLRKKCEKWDKMVAVKKACDAAGVEYPEKVVDFFETDDCDYVSLRSMTEEELFEECRKVPLVTSGDPMCGDGMTIKVKDIPDHVETILIYAG